MIYAFYALQPYLMQLYSDPSAYAIAGLAAAIIAAAQIVGGLIVVHVRRVLRRRTDALLTGAIANVLLLALIGLGGSFWLVLALLAVWAMAFALSTPVRQAFVNGVVTSEQRATVLSTTRCRRQAEL